MRFDPPTSTRTVRTAAVHRLDSKALRVPLLWERLEIRLVSHEGPAFHLKIYTPHANYHGVLGFSQYIPSVNVELPDSTAING
jgi:hypothetical protein